MNWLESRRWQLLAAVLVFCILIWLLGPVLTPFVIAALLGWLGDPLVDRLERSGRSRGAAVAIVVFLITLLLLAAMLVLLPMLWDQLQYLLDSLPALAVWVTAVAVPWLERHFHVQLAQYIDSNYLLALLQSHWQEAGGMAAAVLAKLSSSSFALLEMLANIALVPVLTFYFLRDWDILVARIRELLPRPALATVTRLARESDQVLGGFLRGQLSVMVSLGAIYAFGLWMVGLDLGLLIGFIAGMVSFVPYLGAFVGVSTAVLAVLVQYGDATHLMLVLAVFVIGLTLEGFVLVPWMVGDRIGMHPVAVIFSVMAGGQLFGFLGVLMALPVAAVAMVMLRYAHERYTQSGLYGAQMGMADPGIVVLEPDPGSGSEPPLLSEAPVPRTNA